MENIAVKLGKKNKDTDFGKPIEENIKRSAKSLTPEILNKMIKSIVEDKAHNCYCEYKDETLICKHTA